MIIKILLGLGLILVAVAVIAAFRPSHFRIERSTSVAAPVSAIFPHVNSAQAWDAWSPFLKADPGMKQTHEGPAVGVGSACVFSGPKSGAGRSTIVESRPDELIRFRLEMTKPMTGTNDVVFTFKPTGDRTVVTWTMSGESNYLMKVVGLFMDCDKMVGPQFEQGLADLKALAESGPAHPALAARL